MKRRLPVAFAAILLLCGLTACGEPKLPKEVLESSLVITKEGTVSEYVVESFEEAYYELGEFTDMVNKAVSDYNSQAGAPMVTLVKIEELAGTGSLPKRIRMQLDYKTMGDYEAFSGNTLVYVTAGATLKEALPVSVENTEGKDMLITNAPYRVYAPKKVHWVSGDKAIAEDGSVKLSLDEEDVLTTFLLD